MGSLRGRLTVGHALIVLVSIVAFALTARTLTARMERGIADGRLESAAAALQLVFAREGPALTRAELLSLTRGDLEGAILDRGATPVVTTAPVPTTLLALVSQAASPGAMRVLKVHDQTTNFRVVALALRSGTEQRSALLWRVVDTMADADVRASVVFAIAIPIIVLAAFVAGDLLTRRTLKTLETVAATARTIEATDLSRRLDPVPATRELAELCATLNRMFGRLEAAFERQRRFSADASHELRTPLSVIMAEADLAVDGLASDAEYRQVMGVILREAHTIETLTSDLLALAREEAGIERVDVPVDLAAVAASAVERLSSLARTRRMTIRALPAAPAIVLGNPASIARVPISLLHNALKFADEGGTVDIGVEASSGTVRLVVEDDGPGFSADGLAHALDRFWRSETTRRREGSGLGLAILATLVASAQGTIELANRTPRGARVIVTFPAAEPA